MLINLSQLTKKQKFSFFFVVGALSVLPILIFAAGQIQETRKFAAGSGEIGLRINPRSVEITRSQALTLSVNLYKSGSRSISVSGAQAVITLDSPFTVLSASCVSPFNGLPFVRISGQSVTVMCAIASGANPVAVNLSDVVFANINIRVSSTATLGAADVTFTKTRVTEAGISGQAPDVSTSGLTASFNIVSGTTPVTPTQMISPTPTLTARQICTSSGFTWKSFPNSCVDSCSLLGPNPANCSQVLTNGCDCGANRCWNGSFCALNATGLTPTLTPRPPTRTPTPSPEVFPTEIIPTEVVNPTEEIQPTAGARTCRGDPARLTCFESWRLSFMSGIISDEADMTQDGNVSLLDFELWRRSYLGRFTIGQ